MKKRILRHLRDHGTITSWEAIQEYGCTRLNGEKSHLTRYRLEVN